MLRYSRCIFVSYLALTCCKTITAIEMDYAKLAESFSDPEGSILFHRAKFFEEQIPQQDVRLDALTRILESADNLHSSDSTRKGVLVYLLKKVPKEWIAHSQLQFQVISCTT